MCGIVGFSGFRDPALLDRMCDAIAHRGPDGEGKIEVPNTGITLGMRRLAIIDLKTGDQPFFSADRRVTMVFNGEIYNYRELREELLALGHSFNSQGDTEVVLQAYLAWGDAAWARLHGMFAVAIADTRGAEPELVVVRDRVGMKPVYYIEHDGKLLFASEMKALLAWSDFTADVDLGALRNYLGLRYVPGPNALLKGVRKLPAGHVLRVKNGAFSLERWWSPPSSEPDARMTEGDAVQVFGDAFRKSVRRHMIADVPFGVFLSGGIDSNAIAAMMAEASPQPIKSFSIGFKDFAGDELSRAAITARALGSDHQSILCSEQDFSALPDIAGYLDEPIGDAIVVPMFVLAREASRKVKVVLSGEGADEILGGYMFHRKLVQIETLRRRLPRAIWPMAAQLVELVPSGLLNRFFDYPGSLGDEGKKKIAGFLRTAGRTDLLGLYEASISLFDDDEAQASLVPGLKLSAGAHEAISSTARQEATPFQELVRAQYAHWLPDDILMKADKMTMAHGLEARIPFMDEDVINAAARIPDRYKLAPGVTKKVLRDFSRASLPREIVNSPKAAFYIPLESYVRSPVMQDLIRRTLDPERIRRRGLFRPEWIAAALNSPESAGFLPLKRIFSLIMLELWFDRFCPDASWA